MKMILFFISKNIDLLVTFHVNFLQVLLSKVLYEDCMTFLPECGADKSICISSLTVISLSICGFIMVPCMSDLVE